jgi:putative cell wall-binding protein
MLAWLVGEDVAGRFIEQALSWGSAVQAATGRHHATVVEEVKKQAAALADKLVEDTEQNRLSFAELAPKLTQKTIQSVKASRLSLKDLFGMLSGAQQAELAHEQEIMNDAKHQSFKWGLAKFMAHPSIRFLTQEGQKLRASLKDIWEVCNKDQQFLKYLGEEMKLEVEEVLKLESKKRPDDASTTSKGKKEAGKGKKDEAEPAQPRKKPKRSA